MLFDPRHEFLLPSHRSASGSGFVTSGKRANGIYIKRRRLCETFSRKRDGIVIIMVERRGKASQERKMARLSHKLKNEHCCLRK
jgi:hypothetical protein